MRHPAGMNQGQAALTLPVTLSMITLLTATSSATNPDHYQRPGSSINFGKEKQTHLHFFMHDILSGPRPTAVKAAAANLTLGTVFPPFGTVFLMDDPLTHGPQLRDDAIIGRVQGLYASAGQQEVSFFMGADYTFTKGEHAGGSFSVASRNAVSNTNREVAVVGGRGKFRMARGVALLKTYAFDLTTGNAVIEYNVILLHY